MAQAKSKSRKKAQKPRFRPIFWALRWVFRWLFRGLLALAALILLGVLLYSFINPPTTLYMAAESRRLGGIEHEWVDIEDIDPVMLRSVVAAEDSRFCEHFGFDIAEIRKAFQAGSNRGASTISQQVVKNVFFWQGRSWIRKALEGVVTPVTEIFWSKRRILELYLNVAEFDEGVFGIAAASRAAFGVEPGKLSADQSARLAAVLPSPKKMSAKKPSAYVRKRAADIRDGAATIEANGKAACFSTPGD